MTTSKQIFAIFISLYHGNRASERTIGTAVHKFKPTGLVNDRGLLLRLWDSRSAENIAAISKYWLHAADKNFGLSKLLFEEFYIASWACRITWNTYKWFEWFESLINIYSHGRCCIYKVRRKKKPKTASKANTQLSTEYCRVRMRIILSLCFMYMPIHEESELTTSCLLLSIRLQTLNMSSVNII